MFVSDKNYAYFIRQFDKYLSEFIKIYAYNLLGNHFHFIIKINDLSDLTTFKKLSNLQNTQKSTHDIISHQFKKFFQSYAMAFNKQQNRLGTLFQTPFKRVYIENDNYLRELICYIHTNAQNHHLVDDFKKWKWTSYQHMISQNKNKLLKEEVIDLFEDVQKFINDHHKYSNKIVEFGNEIFIED